jgi:tetratricopeptide (TPR) repeat protein
MLLLAASLSLVVLVTFLAFHGVLQNAFLNWDDADALVANRALEDPGIVRWAFSTTHMSHYQPLSWLAWAAVRRTLGADARSHHLASLLLHLANAALVLVLGLRFGSVLGRVGAAGLAAAVAAALLFAVHPLRVEPVAWASALPYLLALLLLLLASLAYLEHARRPRGSWPWLAAAAALYALSLLARPIAPGFPLVLLIFDLLLGRAASSGKTRILLEKAPLAGLAVAALWLEAGARHFAPLARISLAARLSDAVRAPFVYLFRTVDPIGLSPLDPQPLAPTASWTWLLLGTTVLVVSSVMAVRRWPRHPSIAAAWFAYLALLAPALGLAPSGLQATADRYTYVPGVAIALLAGGALAAAWTRPRLRAGGAAALVAVVATLGIAAARQVEVWRDSVTLWTRAAALDPRNDVALYNLGQALEETGNAAAAADRYRETVRLVPDHVPARRRLDAIEVAGLEREAGELLDANRLDEAARAFATALERDPSLKHAHAGRGIALFRLGRLPEAATELQTAVAGGVADPEVASALAFALAETDRREEAKRVLEAARARNPADVNLAYNLSRLIAGDPARTPADAEEALRLARFVVERTPGKDPRVLDTLASALAAAGRADEADRASAEAVEEARRQGEADLAAVIDANARARRAKRRAHP